MATGVYARRAAVIAGDQVLGTYNIEPAVVQAARDKANQELPLCVKLRTSDGALFGELLVGPRPDDSGYGKAERDALAEIAVHSR